MQWKDSQGYKYIYTGEVDLSDNLCGFGTLTNKRSADNVNAASVTFEGTFFNDKSHGFGKPLCMEDGPYLHFCIVVKTGNNGFRDEFEVVNGRRFGKGSNHNSFR